MKQGARSSTPRASPQHNAWGAANRLSLQNAGECTRGEPLREFSKSAHRASHPARAPSDSDVRGGRFLSISFLGTQLNTPGGGTLLRDERLFVEQAATCAGATMTRLSPRGACHSFGLRPAEQLLVSFRSYDRLTLQLGVAWRATNACSTYHA